MLYEDIRRTREALFAFVATGGDDVLELAVTRTMTLAGWSPEGRTSFRQADQVARGIATTLALAYDWLHRHLSPRQRQRLLDALQRRLSAIHDGLNTADKRLSRHPYDSHANQTLSMFAAMAVILAGDLDEAERWFHYAVPMTFHWTSPWSEEDGGFANGTAYAHWINIDLLLAWNIFRWTLDVDVAGKAWTRNYARFLAYTLPPGTPAGLFGDGAERRLEEQWARSGKAYTQFAPSALGRWYAGELRGDDYSRLQMLLAPPVRLTRAPLPENTADSALFPSIGWAAMHSDLADPGRTSVYFKSSPYGSFNHSHADQNSFVIRSAGERLAIDSGYYDDYDSPHWNKWYKQTRAHNAITFDNGNGQKIFEQSGNPGSGRIVQFEQYPGFDLVTGDASTAYGAKVQRATRTLVYLRPDQVLVYDRLRSSGARRWEWNLHTLREMDVGADRRSLRVDSGRKSLCVRILDGPDVTFEQTRAFTVPPAGKALDDQWHGRFFSNAKSRDFEMLTWLGVDCPDSRPTARREDGTIEVATGAHVIQFGSTVTVRRAQP
jgi:hypothetical protein